MTDNNPVQPPPGQLPLPIVQATGRVISEFACQHLRAAALFRDHVIQIETEHMGQEFGAFFGDIRSYGSACIMSSAAALETLINELFISHTSKLRTQLNDFETEFWGERGGRKRGIERKPILDKYQLALSMLNLSKVDEHRSPYREAWALIELRNALVHYKPTWDPDRKRQVELAEVLDGQFALSPFLDEGADFITKKCMSSGCAKWAVRTVVVFVSEFDTRAQLERQKVRAFIEGAT